MKHSILIGILLLPIISFAQSYSEKIKSHRQNITQSFISNKFSPVRADQVQYLQYFEPNEKFKVNARVQLLHGEQPFRMPTYDGTSNEYVRYALLNFEIEGINYQLTAYKSAALFQNPAYATHLFLPFYDQTNGDETYGGGRYIDLDSKSIKNNSVEIDFNKTYNPYCAYSAGYRCPQPPDENRLETRILAGEKKYLTDKNDRIVDTSKTFAFTAIEKDIILKGAEKEVMHVYLVTNPQEMEVLKKPSQDVKPNDPLLKTLAARMLATVQSPQHEGVGIAAPQVGINKNAIWVQRFDKEDQPFQFFINPKIIWRSELTRKGAEGCLSIPERREEVLRSYAIRLQYWTEDGKIKEENIEGFTAVIVQHEVDHLYGILFPDRIEEVSDKPYFPLNEKIDFSILKGKLVP